jgi:hypothetical protein
MEDLILTELELYSLTGYKKPQFQLKELKRMGFFRARQSLRTGHIILERVHFQAISSGIPQLNQPKRELIYHPSK